MMQAKHTSLADIAKVTGLTTVAVSLALRNRTGVSQKTRDYVRRVAKELGYAPDARLASWMARIRDTKSKRLLPIAWLNSNEAEDAWRNYAFLNPLLRGARSRALELGYHLEEIWTGDPKLSMKRVAKIIDQRGIEGVIVSHPARHMRLNWDRLAAVSIDGSLMAPGIHRVMSDNPFNLSLSLKILRRLGFRRIGVCLTEQVDSNSNHLCRAVAERFVALLPLVEKVKPFFYLELSGGRNREAIVKWLKQTRPDVIVGLDNNLVKWVQAAGYRVPDDVGVAHLAIDDDVSDWAGIYSNKVEIGASAVEKVVALIQNNVFGVPRIVQTTLIRGAWRSGRTVCARAPFRLAVQ